MKITKLELIKIKPRWMFLKMYTDTDIYGLGEPILEGHANSVEAVIREFEDYLIGKDPMMIEHPLRTSQMRLGILEATNRATQPEQR